MNNSIRKFLTCLMVCVLCISLGGCARRDRKKQKETYPNEFRSTDHAYDFIDYLSVITYGEDGDGYVEVIQRDINVSMFPSEEEYIAVKKDLENLKLRYVQGEKVSSDNRLTVSKTEGLSNGDVIQIGVNYKEEDLNSDLNIETYDYVVDGLGVATDIDLFSKEMVTFYATDNGELFYHLHAPRNTLKELKEHLTYEITTDNAIEADKTVLSITATLDKEFMDANKINSLKLFLARNDLRGPVTAEKVLQTVIQPIDYSSANQALVEAALYDALYEIEPDVTKILTLQRSPREASTEQHKATVFYMTTNPSNGAVEYWYREAAIHYVDETYYIESLSNRSKDSSDAPGALKKNYEMLLDFTIPAPVKVEEPPVEEPAEEPVVEATPEPEQEPEQIAAPEDQPSETTPTEGAEG